MLFSGSFISTCKEIAGKLKEPDCKLMNMYLTLCLNNLSIETQKNQYQFDGTLRLRSYGGLDSWK